MEFVLGNFSCFDTEIAYSNFIFCGSWTPSFVEFIWKMSKFQENEHTPGPFTWLNKDCVFALHALAFFLIKGPSQLFQNYVINIKMDLHWAKAKTKTKSLWNTLKGNLMGRLYWAEAKIKEILAFAITLDKCICTSVHRRFYLDSVFPREIQTQLQFCLEISFEYFQYFTSCFQTVDCCFKRFSSASVTVV